MTTSPNKHRRILEMWNAGQNYKQIGVMERVSRHTITRVLRAAEMAGKHVREYSKIQYDYAGMSADYATGMKIAEVARKHGCAYSTVRKAVLMTTTAEERRDRTTVARKASAKIAAQNYYQIPEPPTPDEIAAGYAALVASGGYGPRDLTAKLAKRTPVYVPARSFVQSAASSLEMV